jgi:hypothetical protein
MTCARLLRATAAVTVSTLLGCASYEQTQEQILRDVDAAQSARASAQPKEDATPANVRLRPRITGVEIRRERNELPDIFAKPFTYVTQGEPLAQVAQNLASQIGMPVRVLQTVSHVPPQSVAGSAGVGASTDVNLEWRNRPLRGLLDLIAQRQGVFWRYTPERGVEFFELESRTFHVSVPPGTKKLDSTISLGGGSSTGGGSGATGSSGGSSATGSSGGGGTVSITSSSEIDPYGSMLAAIGAMLEAEEGGRSQPQGAAAAGAAGGARGSQKNGRLIASGDLGVITVTARPPTLDRIGAFIETINRRYTQNVLIDVSIYNVKLSRQNQFGISADLLYKTLSGKGVEIVGAPALALATGATPGQFTINPASPNGRYAGSQIVGQALTVLGDVSLVTTGQVMAVNGQPAPIQVADQQYYLASSSTTVTPNVGATTTLTPGSITVGFTGNFLPMILADNRILLQYQMQLSTATIKTASSGNASIQVPLVSQQSVQQEAYVRDGQSIVLTSFEQRNNEHGRQLGMVGASTTASTDRNMLVIVMNVSTKHTGAIGGKRD